MLTTILISVISAFAALFGVALSSSVQFKIQRSNQDFQLRSEALKYGRERKAREAEAELQRLFAAHKLLCKIAREFSVTNSYIVWSSDLPEHDYHNQYLSSCLDVDELSAFACLYEGSMTSDLNELRDQMNMFWGNVCVILKNCHNPDPFLFKVHGAASEIGRIIVRLQYSISCRSEAILNGR